MAERILPISNSQARDLAGKAWCFNTITWRFKGLDLQNPGKLPWSAGTEGKAYPLLDSEGKAKVFIKFYSGRASKRYERAQWLIAKKIRSQAPQLMAAPALWVDSRENFARPEGVSFDVCGCIAAAAPGVPWLELKTEQAERLKAVSLETRWQMVEELVAALAILENEQIVHGDISPRNVLIDLDRAIGRALVYLIDFDAFESKAMPQSLSLCLEDGGTYGTEGYCPSDLAERAENGDPTVKPYSDRYARDMMILEFLLAGNIDSEDRPPSEWSRSELIVSLAALSKASPIRRAEVIKHLAIPSIFDLKEEDRPSSLSLSKVLRHDVSGDERLVHTPGRNSANLRLGQGIQIGRTKWLRTIGVGICFLIWASIFTHQNQGPTSMRSETSTDSLVIEQWKAQMIDPDQAKFTGNTSTGVGIMWKGKSDVDIYVKPTLFGPELSHKNNQSSEGQYAHDYRTANTHLGYEWVEIFDPHVDLSKMAVAVNHYKGIGPVSGIICMHYQGRVYKKEFQIAGHGNKGIDSEERHRSRSWIVIKPFELLDSGIR